MYGELNFNPSLFIAQMEIIFPFAVGVLIALFIWGVCNERFEKKKRGKKHENCI